MRLTELRRNPDLNIKQSVYEFLQQYKDDPNVYIHTTSIDKVGINPKFSDTHDSPLGIYAFRLQDVWKDYIEYWNTGNNSRGLSMLPYYGGNKVFVLRSDIPTDSMSEYTKRDLVIDINKLRQMFDLSADDINRLKKTATTNLNYVDHPIGVLWGMTKAIASGMISEFDAYTTVNAKAWAMILRKLGHKAFNDKGHGFIHGAEGTQALFLSNNAFEVIDKYQITTRKRVEINGKKYQSPPRKLHMKSIPNTFFYNNEPSDLKKVREWTVESMNVIDFGGFLRFLPWNATGHVHTMGLTSTYGLHDVIGHLKNNNRVQIDMLIVGLHDDFDKIQVFKELVTTPLDKITRIKYYPPRYARNTFESKLDEIIPPQYREKFTEHTYR